MTDEPQIPPWQDMKTLCWHICMTEEEVWRMVETGELPKPERTKPKNLWRWSQVDRMLMGGADSRHRVYFIEMNEFIKIGYSSNLERRIENLALGHPYEIRLLHDIEGSFDLETDLHRRFAHIHVRGEWFRKEQELLDYIEILKGAE